MGRTSFTQELKVLGKASEEMDVGVCWREMIFLHRELGRHENALGRAAWMMRYGQRGEWRAARGSDTAGKGSADPGGGPTATPPRVRIAPAR